MERPIRCLRDSFFYGREFVNDEDLNAQALRWLEGTANVRRHGTTGRLGVQRVARTARCGGVPPTGPDPRAGTGRSDYAPNARAVKERVRLLSQDGSAPERGDGSPPV